MIYKILAAASLGATLIATPVIAGEKDTNSVAIEYKDLNLGTAEGQAVLDRRIEKAARQMCGVDRERTGTHIVPSANRRCLAEARKSAKETVAQLVSEQQLGG